MRTHVHAVMINTADPHRLAHFWGSLLGVEIGTDLGDYIWLRSTHKGGVSMAFQKVTRPLAGHSETHVDLSVDDLDDAQRLIEELGGALVARHAIGDFTWRIMHDPDGNEFCIVPGH